MSSVTWVVSVDGPHARVLGNFESRDEAHTFMATVEPAADERVICDKVSVITRPDGPPPHYATYVEPDMP